MFGNLDMSNVDLGLSAPGAQCLSGRVLESRPRGHGFEPHRRHCAVSLSKNINPCLVLVQPRKTRLFITDRLLKGRKESNKTNHTAPSFSYSVLSIANLYRCSTT